MRRKQTNAAEVLELWQSGVSMREIGRRMGCSGPNIYQIIRRRYGWTGRLEPLPAEHHQWLEAEARASNVPVNFLVRALLVDAIEEARDSQRKGKQG